MALVSGSKVHIGGLVGHMVGIFEKKLWASSERYGFDCRRKSFLEPPNTEAFPVCDISMS